jgi:hypothetical protein
VSVKEAIASPVGRRTNRRSTAPAASGDGVGGEASVAIGVAPRGKGGKSATPVKADREKVKFMDVRKGYMSTNSFFIAGISTRAAGRPRNEARPHLVLRR